MAKGSTPIYAATIAKWISEGRGQGELQHYLPWLRVRNVSSRGLSSRIPGHKTGRVHHFFSRLELMFFFILEWSLKVVDIWEQYPLQSWQDTLLIAETLGIRHPRDSRTKHCIVQQIL